MTPPYRPRRIAPSGPIKYFLFALFSEWVDKCVCLPGATSEIRIIFYVDAKIHKTRILLFFIEKTLNPLSKMNP